MGRPVIFVIDMLNDSFGHAELDRRANQIHEQQAEQFNMVVSTNASAVALWKKFGFSVVGTLPQAYRRRELGLVDAYVMHRFL